MSEFNLSFSDALKEAEKGKKITGEGFVEGYYFIINEFGFFELKSLNDCEFKQNMETIKPSADSKFKIIEI